MKGRVGQEGVDVCECVCVCVCVVEGGVHLSLEGGSESTVSVRDGGEGHLRSVSPYAPQKTDMPCETRYARCFKGL